MRSFEDLLKLPATDKDSIRPGPIEIPGIEFKKFLLSKGLRLVPNAIGLWAYLKYNHLGFAIIENRVTNETFLKFSEYTVLGKEITFYPLCSPEQTQYELVEQVYDEVYYNFELSPLSVGLPDTVTTIPGNLYRFFTRNDGDLNRDFTSNIVRTSRRVTEFIASL
jgi:hypothetical protein